MGTCLCVLVNAVCLFDGDSPCVFAAGFFLGANLCRSSIDLGIASPSLFFRSNLLCCRRLLTFEQIKSLKHMKESKYQIDHLRDFYVLS